MVAVLKDWARAKALGPNELATVFLVVCLRSGQVSYMILFINTGTFV